MNNILKVSNSSCFGCTACKAICPVNAIYINANEEGFLIPAINESRCIMCGKCLKVCPAIEKWVVNINEPDVFAVVHNNYEVTKRSTSGGFFSAVAEWVLKMEGVVYGAAFDRELRVMHIGVDNISKINIIRGSKYVQSDIKDCFCEIHHLLSRNRKVLFTGTSCQVDGLKRFLKLKNVSLDNLYCIDIICHGVASPKIFREFLNYYQKNKKKKVIYYKFRNKMYGWGIELGYKNYIQSIVLENGKVDNRSWLSQMWSNIFFSDYCTRECCYHCPYTNVSKPGDVSMGDFWGIRNIFQDSNFSNGASLVLVQNEKGMEMIKNLDIYLKHIEEKKEALCFQSRLYSPTKKPSLREQFWRDYKLYDFSRILKKYFYYTNINKVKYFVKRTLCDCHFRKISDKLFKDIII